MTTDTRSDFDRCFESTLLGNRQAELLHKFQTDIDMDIWHVCTLDSNNYYETYYVRLDRKLWTISRYEWSVTGIEIRR